MSKTQEKKPARYLTQHCTTAMLPSLIKEVAEHHTQFACLKEGEDEWAVTWPVFLT